MQLKNIDSVHPSADISNRCLWSRALSSYYQDKILEPVLSSQCETMNNFLRGHFPLTGQMETVSPSTRDIDLELLAQSLIHSKHSVYANNNVYIPKQNMNLEFREVVWAGEKNRDVLSIFKPWHWGAHQKNKQAREEIQDWTLSDQKDEEITAMND